MARTRACWLEITCLAIALMLTASACADEPKVENAFRRAATQPKPGASAAETKRLNVAIYSLSDLGGDPSLGKWIADTITEVIDPTTWQHVGGEGRLSYHAPAKLLVVYQTAAVHSQVDAFLNNIKKAVPQAKQPAGKMGKMSGEHGVMPAQFNVTELTKQSDAAASSKSAAYPVPPPLQQPKHLFHVVIRYEGDGIVDANVVDLLKSFTGEESQLPKEEKGANSEPAKASKLNQLFNFIIRYEGDGIIDANVVELFKAYMDSVAKEGNSSNGIVPPANVLPPNAAPAGAPSGATYPTLPGIQPGVTPLPAPTTGPNAAPQAVPATPASRPAPPLTMPPATTSVTPVPTAAPFRNLP